jgi:predicted anti-sigma-YlaC factor YlaD
MSLVLRCREAMDLLTEADEGALTGAAKATFEAHLAICVPCKRYRAQMATTREVLRAIAREPAAPADVDAVLRRIAEGRDD